METYVHVMESLIDFVEFAVVSDVLVNLDLALQVVYNSKMVTPIHVYISLNSTCLRRDRAAQCGPSHHRKQNHAKYDQ